MAAEGSEKQKVLTYDPISVRAEHSGLEGPMCAILIQMGGMLPFQRRAAGILGGFTVRDD